MKKFKVNKKAGFLVTKNPVIIYDSRLKPFYNTDEIKKPVKAFNLPVGEYYLQTGGIKQMEEPIAYSYYKLPTPERFRKLPKNFKIKFDINPNKCSIDWNKKTITFDHSMKDLTWPELMFILYHEHGHHRYSTEKYCDLFAANCMLKKGFNPQQIGKASLLSLSENQFERKSYLVNEILK